jgi:SAM-dependent methyltransferase
MLLHLARRGRAVGIDQAAEALRGCRRRGVRAARGSVGALPFADASFDAVTCFDVLYHRRVGDERAAARELARVLRPGGVLLVRVPALPILWGAHDEAVHGRHRYVRGELAGLLAAAGLEVVRTTYANGLLLPVVLLRRSLDRLTGRAGSDVGPVPPLLDRALRAVLELEARWVRRFPLPLGSSLFALARRPG